LKAFLSSSSISFPPALSSHRRALSTIQTTLTLFTQKETCLAMDHTVNLPFFALSATFEARFADISLPLAPTGGGGGGYGGGGGGGYGGGGGGSYQSSGG